MYWGASFWDLFKIVKFVLPSTNDVKSVTLAALRRPAGKFKPIFSNFSLSNLPPFLLLALQIKYN